jgi:hypothetical protein
MLNNTRCTKPPKFLSDRLVIEMTIVKSLERDTALNVPIGNHE